MVNESFFTDMLYPNSVYISFSLGNFEYTYIPYVKQYESRLNPIKRARYNIVWTEFDRNQIRFPHTAYKYYGDLREYC